MVYMIATCVFMYSRYMIISRYWYWFSRYWIYELSICDVWNPTSIIPVSRYPILCYQQSSCPVIMLHVPCTVLVLDTLCTLTIINITWGWGRLDGWLGLIGWMSESIVCPAAGEGVVLATVCYSSWAPVFHYCISSLSSRFSLLVIALVGWPWSQRAV